MSERLLLTPVDEKGRWKKIATTREGADSVKLPVGFGRQMRGELSIVQWRQLILPEFGGRMPKTEAWSLFPYL